jgi:hypothetical protein
MIHYGFELALWMAGLFLIGCPLGALARGLVRRRRAPGRPHFPGGA